MNNKILTKIPMIFVSLLMILYATMSFAREEPILTIESRSRHAEFSRSQLLAMNPKNIRMSNNRAYPGMPIIYTSLKLCELLKDHGIKPGDILEFIATDSFSVLIPASKIMRCDLHSSAAWLAIEPESKWPSLRRYNTYKTAGPFDVIWVNPEKSCISDEYWAWSVVKIIVHEKLDAKLAPPMPFTDDKLAQTHLNRGHEVYISHCAGCHAMNNYGKGSIGPDLNLPKNPTEYYPSDALLKKFIRNPQSVRKIPYDRMSGSNKKFLSEADLDDLIRYFHYMKKHKKDAHKT